MTTKLEIFWGSGSPNAWRVLLTAELKRIPYDSKLLQFSTGDLKQPDFIAINPRAKVPAIRDGDYRLYESLAIMAYLDRRNPEPPIFGRTPAETGRIWRAISEFACYLDPPWNAMLLPIVFGKLSEKLDSVRTASETVGKELARLEQSIDSQEWLCGQEISAADLAIYPFLKFLVRVAGKDEVKSLGLGMLPFDAHYPKLTRWMQRVEALPGYARTYPPHWN